MGELSRFLQSHVDTSARVSMADLAEASPPPAGREGDAAHRGHHATAFADQDFSLADRTSWAVMQRLGIHDAISLDQDFRVYRFGPGRQRRFNVSS